MHFCKTLGLYALEFADYSLQYAVSKSLVTLEFSAIRSRDDCLVFIAKHGVLKVDIWPSHLGARDKSDTRINFQNFLKNAAVSES